MCKTYTRRDVLGAAAVGGLGVFGFGGRGHSEVRAVGAARKPTEVPKGVRQLFLDDILVERIDGLKRVVNPPTKHAHNPIIRHDQTPWQTFRAQLYGTVLYVPEEERFKAWYLAGARLPHEKPITVNGRLCIPNFQFVGYAESEDGFRFNLPNLGLVNVNGSTKNNLCRISRECAEGIAVLYDRREPDARRRYKALYWEHAVSYKGSPVTPVNGMSVSFSADGKNWTNPPGNPVIPLGSDTGQQAVWDANLNKYVAYGRFGAGGRRVARSDSDDFVHWSKPELVFQADSRDGPGGQIYGMGVSIYEGVYLGMPWVYHAGTTHKIDVQLATSRDGVRWTRVGGRQTFIPNGPPGSWDAGIVFTASQPAQIVGDRVFVFYSACRKDHDYAKPPEKGTPAWDAYWDSIKTSIGVATLRRDGFVSLDASDVPGSVVTKPIRWPKDAKLHVNADASGGAVHVAVLDEAAKPIAGLDKSGAIMRNCLDATVAWPTTAPAPPTDRPVRLRITLRKAKLYAYWFAD